MSLPPLPELHEQRAQYRSGVAARLAGLPVETLRVWERRYALSDTGRSERGQRLYSDVQVRRLRLIKQLVDQGHPIGALAQLPLEQLARMTAGPVVGSPAQPLRVALMGAALGRRFDKFNLFGFSGGGHFAHRFLYLWPDRLDAVSVGAPGSVTRIDDTRDFWLGTRNFETVFGKPLDLPAIRKVPVQLVVGACDVEEFVYPPQFAAFVEDMGDIGKNRIERNTKLLENYQANGLDVRQTIVPKVAHDGHKVVDAVTAFFQSAFHTLARV